MYVGRVILNRTAFYANWEMDGKPALLEREGRIYYVDSDRNQVVLSTTFAESDLPSMRLAAPGTQLFGAEL